MSDLQREAARRAKIMLAFSEGKRIRRRARCNSEAVWVEDCCPDWDWFDFEYEVMPQTAKEAAREFFHENSNWISREDYFIAGAKWAREQDND